MAAQAALAVCIIARRRGDSLLGKDFCLRGENGMYERRYLMSVEALADGDCDENLWRSVKSCLDRDRLGRLERTRLPGKRAESAGAGLLLQWAYLCWQKDRAERTETTEFPEISVVTMTDIMEKVQFPAELEICSDSHGKPYLRGRPFCYNLSHSGDYVFCAVSEREIGADIQRRVPGRESRVAGRFFSGREAAAIRAIGDETERSKLFYRLWTRKEALGKLSGEGIASCAAECLLELDRGTAGKYIWEEYELAPDYNIACCREKTNSFGGG